MEGFSSVILKHRDIKVIDRKIMNLNLLCLFWSLVGRMLALDYYDYDYDYGDMPDVPDWPYKMDGGKGQEEKVESGPKYETSTVKISSGNCDCAKLVFEAVQAEKTKFDFIQTDCDSEKDSLSDLNEDLAESLEEAQNEIKSLTLSSNSCQAKLIRKDKTIADSLERRKELTANLVEVRGNLTTANTNLLECEDMIAKAAKEEEEVNALDAKENQYQVREKASDLMEIQCQSFRSAEVQLLTNKVHILWAAIVGLGVMVLCLILAVIYCKVEYRRNRKNRRVRQTSWYLENPTYYLGTSSASGPTDSLPLPTYQSYRESMSIQNANRQASGWRSWFSRGARNDVMELQERQDPRQNPRQDPPTLPNQNHEETFSIREEQQDQAEDMPELEEVRDDSGSEGRGSSEGERALVMRDIILLEAALEIVRLKEAVFWFGEVLNWYRTRELELGLSLDLFELEPRFEEIDGLDSEYNKLTNLKH